MSDIEHIIKETASIAESWQNRSNELLTDEEKTFQKRMKKLLTHPMDKVILTKMIDQSFRSKRYRRIADQIASLFNRFGMPTFFSLPEKLLTQLFLIIGKHVHFISVPVMIDQIRKESSRVILQGEETPLFSHLKKRRENRVRMNINHLGEAVLGEEEASDRLVTYIADLKHPEIEYISVKISTIYSQIHSLSFSHTVSVLKERFSTLYRTAQKNYFVQKNGNKVQKFVNLDMEEYRDLHITIEAFIETLDQDEFISHPAGIVLQSYLPDSFDLQKKLTDWAKKRVEKGGAPIKIRIVKGANMETEKVDSSINNWSLATYDNKLDVDANFKLMVEFGMQSENIHAVHLGIASHNLFELAYAFWLAQKREVIQYVTFEMLEGMADHVRRAIQEKTENMLLYAPVALKEQFINAIAYLIRRLDENTAKENFLRYSCNLRTDSLEWTYLKEQFAASVKHMHLVHTTPSRHQDRTKEQNREAKESCWENTFDNEPNTDWVLASNRTWAESVRNKWMKTSDDAPYEIPVVVNGEELFHDRGTLNCADISQVNPETVLLAKCAMAENEDIDKAVSIAKEDPDGWRKTGLKKRREILVKVAHELRKARGDLIGASAAHTGKTFEETDVEVSEAIDFAEYYPHSLKSFVGLENIECSGKGVGVVISPWNFPVAIPCGGIVSSLAAGNTVIFKPASSAVIPAWELCQCFWKAGVSKKTLQFLPCSGQKTGQRLVVNNNVDFVIFTGGTDTALEIIQKRPEIYFAGETGGKNATIVTSMSDRDQAIKNVIHSAFSNCGQKCSATSLLILEKEVFEDKSFRKTLVDATKSQQVGSVWEFQSLMGPLIHSPDGKLKYALTHLEPGEEWALKPQNINGNPHLWTPGIKWNVQPGSYTHRTEFFGPLLGVMCADNLEHAISLANQTGYGLTSGLESLDRRERSLWKKKIKAGNLYINRGTTGAVVLRQPFGGMGKSAIGAGIKAGGPNYSIQFMDIRDTGFPEIDALETDHPLLRLAAEWKQKLQWNDLQEFKADLTKTIYAIKSYLYANDHEFTKEKDYFHLRGQDNIVRYLSLGKMVVRIHENDTLFEILARIAAGQISECDTMVSLPANAENAAVEFLYRKEGKRLTRDCRIIRQSDMELLQMIPEIQGIRYAAPDRVPHIVLEKAAEKGFYISRTPVLMEGRVELLQYYREQSICYNYHRYGNLGERSEELLRA